MNYLNQIKAALLGLIQGLTEFLPVSSSGHLILIQNLINFNDNVIIFDVFLHLGTLLAILLFYRTDILNLLKNFKSMTYLAVATIPAVIVGLTLNDQIGALFSKPLLIAFPYFITATWLYLGHKKTNDKNMTPVNITIKIAVLIGIAQAIAIVPGISRSGATIIAAILLNVERKEAAKFSFLLSIPIILGAVILEGSQISTANIDLLSLVVGTLAAFISGFIALKILLKILVNGKLNVFSYYCFALGILIIILFH